jgi:hypothetical protein
VCHISLEKSQWGIQFCFRPLDLIAIRGLHEKLWAFKMAKVLILKISGFPTWKSWEKWHLGATPMVNHKEYDKGEGDDFFQIWVVVCFMTPCMLVVCPCTKNVWIMH